MTQLPIFVESNRKVTLQVDSPLFEEVRNQISNFLSLVKSPQKFYTYYITKLSLWNGFSTGLNDKDIISLLEKYSRYPIPTSIHKYIKEYYTSYGVFRAVDYNDTHYELKIEDKTLPPKVLEKEEIKKYLEYDKDKKIYLIEKANKGLLKSNLIKLNFPVKDFCSFKDGDSIDIDLKSHFVIRDYQKKAIDTFLGNTDLALGGSGVLVMPCGSGKTIIGILTINHFKMSSLIITPNIISLRQWKKELLANTNFSPEDIGEYSGNVKEIKKITITTYQILTYRNDKESKFKHLPIFNKQNWGLIIYDEIHMLPATMFRYVTAIQSIRRLGLTATLVREDGKETDVFSLIGPKKFDLPWKELESQRHIAEVKCFEIKIPMNQEMERNYFTTTSEIKQYRIASENPGKLDVIKEILKQFPKHQTIIIGQYISQLEIIAKVLNAPLLTGKTSNIERERLYKEFNLGEINPLVVSKVANFAVDLPNAQIAIQISGSFGSRQEEAQRLGRIIRPKNSEKDSDNQAYFFTLVTQYTKEEIFSQNRKNFLINQGYSYQTVQQSRASQIARDYLTQKTINSN